MSLTGITAYLQPGTLEEAYGLLDDRSIAVGGGTDIIRHPHIGVTTLVDLGALPLRYLRHESGFAIGGTATLSDMLEHPGLAAHLDGVVAEMLRGVGSPLLRNAATIGGHLARGRYSDIVPLLLALDATLTLFDGTERTLSLADYYRAGLHRSRALISEIGLPPAGPDTAAAFLKFTRVAFDYALLNCAVQVRLDGRGMVEEARVAVGETPALGALVEAAAQSLEGGPLDDGRIDASAELAAAAIPAQDDQRASAEYRRALCRVGVRRALFRARGRLEGRRQ
ncbi:MAG: FAD binding domain-containing protein [Acidimicrobiia bacterium]|nr:FAD binding domain-containing protein [Acidimicrobiia bacterium]